MQKSKVQPFFSVLGPLDPVSDITIQTSIVSESFQNFFLSFDILKYFWELCQCSSFECLLYSEVRIIK